MATQRKRRKKKRKALQKKPDRVFRVLAKETRGITDPDCVEKEQWGYRGHTRVTVQFSVAMICPDNFTGGFDTHHVETEDLDHPYAGEYSPYGSRNIDWNYAKDRIWLIVARYSDGDTFGSSSGEWSIEGVASTLEEASEFRRLNRWQIEKKHDNYFGKLEEVELVLVPFERVLGEEQ